MRIKLEYCSINPTQSSKGSRFSMHFMEIRVDNNESIKKTMQMHEDMFKHQVRELHRLYSVQKTLMDELKKRKTNRLCATSMTTTFDINQSHLINTQHSKTQITCVEADPSSRETSCSGDHIHAIKMASGFDLERPAGEDNSAQDEDSEIELTLSIGGSSKKKKMAKSSKSKPYNQSNGEEIREIDTSASFKSKRGEDFIGLNTPVLSFPWFKLNKHDLTPLNNI